MDCRYVGTCCTCKDEKSDTHELFLVTAVVKGKKVRALIDPGCRKTLVQQDLINQKDLINQELIFITCVHGD
ncbi:hypothetical protein FKM82_001363 [Ascaphus truei]